MKKRLALLVVLIGAALGAPVTPSAAVTFTYLTIDLGGNGSGSVQSLDGQIYCLIVNGVVDERSACSGQYVQGENVTVDTYPATGNCYQHESFCDSSDGRSSIPMTIDRTFQVRIYFIQYTLTVTKSGTATGKVTSPLGINCGTICIFGKMRYGTPVVLNAVADPGGYFAGWTQTCAGQDASCDLTIHGDTSANAVFLLGTPPPTTGPTASPGHTATATTTPTSTPRSTTKPSTTSAPPTAGTPVEPNSTPASSESAPETVPATVSTPSAGPPGATSELPTASSGSVPAEPAGSTGGTDLGPIVLAILGAGLLIAIGIGFAGYLFVRRRPAGS